VGSPQRTRPCGTVNIRGTERVAWNGVAYTKADCGRQVLFNDLMPGDVVLLLELELDVALPERW
jgi:hypothetical protein